MTNAWKGATAGGRSGCERRPDTGDGPAAVRAAALRRQGVVQDRVAEALDQRSPAAWTDCVLVIADAPRQVPAVDAPQPLPAADLRRTQERPRAGVVGVGQLVGLVERRHGPGDV